MDGIHKQSRSSNDGEAAFSLRKSSVSSFYQQCVSGTQIPKFPACILRPPFYHHSPRLPPHSDQTSFNDGLSEHGAFIIHHTKDVKKQTKCERNRKEAGRSQGRARGVGAAVECVVTGAVSENSNLVIYSPLLSVKKNGEGGGFHSWTKSRLFKKQTKINQENGVSWKINTFKLKQ